MSKVVLVHGIAQELKGPHSLLDTWYPALADGLALGGGEVDRAEVSMAFYGDLFRPGGHRATGVPELDASDVADGLERDLLLAWWREASRSESAVPGPGDPGRLRTPRTVQRALDALSHSAFFSGLSERLLIFSARQVRRYLTEEALRGEVRTRAGDAVTGETRVVVAHSLGTVVAYEALCGLPAGSGITLVTLGSPLGIRNLIFDRLVPRPAEGRAQWPSPVARWVNVADAGDAVALVKELAPSFGQEVRDLRVHNGSQAHDVRPYLTARATGEAIAAALRD